MDKKPEKLVPEVRFKGFTDDWEQHKLGEISFKVNTKNKENLTLPVLSNSAEYGIVNQEDYFDKKIANRTDNYYIVKHNDFVYNPRISKKAPYGPIRRNTLDTKGLMSPLYYVFRINDGNYIYLDYYFKSSKWYKFMYQNGDSGARSDRFAIKDKIFQMMPINMPNTKEQNKIGQLIQTLQKLIDLQQRKLKQLKQLKKAMLQQLFVDKNSKQPNLRFKNFNSDWKQRKLKNISKRILRKNSDLQSLLPLTISAQDGLVDQTLYFNKQVASKQLKNYLLLYNGDFAYNKSYSVGYPYGAIKRLDKYKQGVLSTLYIAFKPTNINSDFLQHYYDTDKWYREIYRNAAEGARNHGLLNISANDFFNSKLVIPSDNDEQLKIAKIINLFNHLITLRQDNLTQLTILKKYLLQKLFI